MAITVKPVKREFIYNNNKLEDINPELSIQEIIQFYSTQHPELVNASYTEEQTIEPEGVVNTITIKKNVGTKG